jgi:hypothetical protein
MKNRIPIGNYGNKAIRLTLRSKSARVTNGDYPAEHPTQTHHGPLS